MRQMFEDGPRPRRFLAPCPFLLSQLIDPRDEGEQGGSLSELRFKQFLTLAVLSCSDGMWLQIVRGLVLWCTIAIPPENSRDSPDILDILALRGQSSGVTAHVR